MTSLGETCNYGPSSAADPHEGRRVGAAFWASVILHLAVVVVLVLVTLWVRDRVEEQPQVFEVVAGPGDDFMATAAPQGAETAPLPTLRMPRLPTVSNWTPPPVRPAPEVAPPQPRPPEREATPTTTTTRFEDFQRQQRPTPAQRTTPPPRAEPVPRIDAAAIRQGVAAGVSTSTQGAGGTAAQAAERDRMDAYFAMLIQRLRDTHEKPVGLSDLLSAEVQFTVAANGVISGVRILRSSGNADFDRSVQDAFSRVRMPTRPDGKTDVQRLTFRMREAA